jgi:hypothetical protein
LVADTDPDFGMSRQEMTELMKWRKVRHHNHQATDNVFKDKALFVGSAHAYCNLNLQHRRECTIIFHNLKSFDSKFVILGAAELGLEMQVIAKNMENFCKIVVKNPTSCNLRFIDSCMHLPQSLRSLTDQLLEDGEDKFKITHQLFYKKMVGDFSKLLGKLSFPYDYVNSDNLFDPIHSLPDIKHFFNKLSNSACKIQDYNDAQLIFTKFGCKNMGEFMRVYNLLDCSLLCDIWISHCENWQNTYNANPTNYTSLSSMSFQVGMRHTAITLKYVRTMDLFLLLKLAQIGGIVNLSKRYAIANIPGYPNYNPNLPTLYIIQLDINSLYSFVMATYPLPIDSFKRKSSNFCKNFDPMQYDVMGETCFLIQCDLETPPETHEWLRDLPPFPHRVVLNMDDLSNGQQAFYFENEDLNDNTGKESLLLTLLPKQKYVLFLPMLQEGLKLGAKITKIHQIYSYRQGCYLKDWIQKNIYLRSVAKTVGESNLVKMVLNSFSGFLGLDSTRFRNIQIVTEIEKAKKLIAKHNFCGVRIINEFLVLMESHKHEVEIKNHLFVNAAILDASKAVLYKLVYGFKNNLKEKISFCYFDTDSFMCEIQTDDLWKTLSEIRVDGKPVMDFSFLPKTHPYYSDKLKGVAGLLKDDNMKNGLYRLIDRVVLLTKKGYAIKFFESEEDKLKMKGIKRPFLKTLNFDAYYNTLFDKQVTRLNVNCLRSKDLQIQNVTINKLALTPACNSRYVLDDLINTLPFGHFAIPK